ncbi:MAG: signal peptide peptidase SppA [Anaerolineae bacterium]|jgi:protease-4
MAALPGLRRTFSNLLKILSNLIVSLRRRGLDYVVIRLTGSYPERREPPPALPFPLNRLVSLPVEVSLEGLRQRLETLARDRRVRGVALHIGQLTAEPATVQALRGMVKELQSAGKQVICWLPSADTWVTYLAAACDKVFLPESGTLFAPGLRVETVFLRDALGLAGVEADLEAFSEYKVTPDLFRRMTMSEPHREMLEAILDSEFKELVRSIAEGRGLSQERVRALMDRMPLSAQEAVEGGLTDDTLYVDELAAALGSEECPAPLLEWHQARRWLRRPVRWRDRPAIGVVSVEGTIVLGPSRRLPPLPVPIPLMLEQAGSDTVMQALRAAEEDQRIAAVILHVESPGGSALASDLIWREVNRLKQRKPVVTLMGNQATSGGYYVSAPANAIVSQPFTLTGSIGIWGGKFVTAGLLDKLRIGREALQRGDRAGLYADSAPFTKEQREAIQEQIGLGYDRFKARVAEGRNMNLEQVEEIARGRVWTGRQALKRGLVDELGGFENALRRAKSLAGLDPHQWYPTVTVRAPQQTQLPRPHLSSEGTLTVVMESWQALGREHVWALPPWKVQLLG